MAYTKEEIQAFREKDERISRTAAFNNVVALRVAEAEITHDTKGLSLSSIMDDIDTVVFQYLWNGKRPDNKAKPVSNKNEASKGKPSSALPKPDNPLPVPDEKQQAVLDKICKEEDFDMELLKAAIIKTFFVYPKNLKSIPTVLNKIDVTNLK